MRETEVRKPGNDYSLIEELHALGMIPETCFVDLCVDFDGVLHAYTTKWIEADVIPDIPVDGMCEALYEYLDAGLTLAIFSARSGQLGGIPAMKKWLSKHDLTYRHANWSGADVSEKQMLVERIEFPVFKPAAKGYLDDRAIRFNGPPFPSAAEIREQFTPWNRPENPL